MKRKIRLNRRGVSLISALVGLVVLAVAMLGVAETFMRAMRNNGSAGAVTELMNLAERTSDAAMLLPVTQAQVTTWTDPSGSTNGLGVTYNHNLYTVQYKLTDSPITGVTGDTHTQKLEVEADFTTGYARSMGVQPGTSKVRMVSYRYKN